MNYKKSKYSRDNRKHIVESIENLKNDEDYVEIFKILMRDEANSYTHNSNGVFLNLSLVSDKTLNQINKYINKLNNNNNNHIEIDTDVIPNFGSAKNERTYRLSNYEKNIIKQRNLKKDLECNNDYEEFRFSTKKSKIKSTNKPSNDSKKSTESINKSRKSTKKSTSKSNKTNKSNESNESAGPSRSNKSNSKSNKSSKEDYY
ncbi:hypothetical protein QLL95_gp0946 [Cotonvirus japonicus]|uniref:NET domain-containing protein n=1 Tax=Cotonvirus japonicus TaxID=2811091 RepID=A0ABM7NSW2_9VIRU|nr:hypothetical protein QLL95_gp0946 [Cotonvirus japonicus]BCS83177.1 hypothetical protein [Cotonvirus japonicus]